MCYTTTETLLFKVKKNTMRLEKVYVLLTLGIILLKKIYYKINKHKKNI